MERYVIEVIISRDDNGYHAQVWHWPSGRDLHTTSTHYHARHAVQEASDWLRTTYGEFNAVVQEGSSWAS